MNSYKFNVKGQERKALVSAMSEILNVPVNYQGAPTFAYEVGGYRIDKNGMMTGEYDLNLFVGLAERGFEPEIEATETSAETAPYEEPVDCQPDSGRLTIEMPLEGFTPENLDNLCKLVESKAVLLKKALGAEELPIRVFEDRIAFPWFPLCDNADFHAYAQFICALCATAKEKKRVTAKPQETFENEKFALRVWMIGLGLVGKEYNAIRKLMMANLSGNSSWRYCKSKKTIEEAAPAPEAVETPAEDIPVEPAP